MAVSGFRSVLFAVAVACLVLPGCGGGGTGGPATGKDPFAIFVNASENSGSVLFALNDDAKSGALTALKQTAPVQFPFVDQAEGGYDVSLESSDRSEVFDAESRVFDRDSSTLVLAFGLRDFGVEDAKRLRLGFFGADRTAPVGNRARLIVLHAYNLRAGFQTPNIDFLSAEPSDPDNLDNPQFSLTDIPYGQARVITVDVDPVAANALLWVVKRNDADARLSQAVRPSPALKAGSIYLVVVSGLEDADADTRDATLTFLPIPVQAG
jgi:hypothetical protein